MPKQDEHFELLQATCALPFLFPVYHINGKPYMDGGTADAIPYDHAVEKGCDRVVVILTREKSYVRKTESIQPLIDRFYRKYPKFCDAMRRRAEVYNACREKLFRLEKEGRVLLIAPTNTQGFSRTERDLAKIKALYQDGYQQAVARQEEIRAFLKS